LKIDKDPTPVNLAELKDGYASVVDLALPAVVNISSTKAESGATVLHGLQVQNLTPSIARDRGVSANTPGVVITSVDPSSEAAAASLQRGDIIQEVNRRPIHGMAEYDRILAEIQGQSILLLVSPDEALATSSYRLIKLFLGSHDCSE